jgi:hypothetical protein
MKLSDLRNKYVYLAGPYSLGDQAANVHRICVIADKLMDIGAIVYNPLLSHFQQILRPRPTDYWYDHTLRWLARCDVMVYLPGKSKGVLQERTFAKQHGIPVYQIEEVKGL